MGLFCGLFFWGTISLGSPKSRSFYFWFEWYELMVRNSGVHQFEVGIVVEIPLFIGFYRSFRWFAMGFSEASTTYESVKGWG